MLQADLVYKQVDSITNWCDCGHYSIGTFKRDESGFAEPIRFFEVSGKGINGIYCEPCLVVVNWLIKKRKSSKK